MIIGNHKWWLIKRKDKRSIKIFYFTAYLYSLKFVVIFFAWIVFVGTVLVISIIPFQVITESPVMSSKYFLFSQVYVLEFQI